MPATIGRYAVERELGRGGMGRVYLAWSEAGEPVAVKVIRQDRIDVETRRRFEREALIARTVIGTSQVPRVLGADSFADEPWLAMEYVAGATLRDFVAEHGPLPAPLVVGLGVVLVDGLRGVHGAGLVHRDMKPQNIILADRGPVLIDFGLGAFVERLGESISSGGRFLGTLCYMAPEQVDGVSTVTTKTDLHALGAVLLYAATGNLPYGNDGAVTLNRICDRAAPPELDGLPAALVPLVGSLLAHDPDDRPSLEAVLATYVELLTAAGTTVRDVRRMLVAETFREVAEAPSRSSSLDARLAGLAAKFVELPADIGGLDRPVGLGGALVPPPEPEPATPVSAGRVAARLRVANRLREQYGRQLPLWSSSSRRPV
ncbi:serine/threonine-protein kinase [Amycolatopsis sp. PS_44_ISF1]|uniref:serine/threonine-protein kinase n=1 Tax=Amycolatopsis sp. PS_44_ISF1 TaxID=2974917 RepID=UPI0028DFEFE2|nr:serine/threonine-protein kinase [Amycolatopsis sp. PS_44_ISF1]MDT8910052.1 serine/threonine protein kinase [Amycolatopsis sp. PS_44_ISF1]